jgi:hypothetical protein
MLMFDYALNVVVVALPASRYGVPLAMSARDTVVFTLIAQVADRIGMALGIAIVIGVRLVMPGVMTMAALGATTPYMLALNFMTSGALVWLLARHYLVQRWNVPYRRASTIAIAAAVLTNPAWAIGVAPLVGLVER